MRYLFIIVSLLFVIGCGGESEQKNAIEITSPLLSENSIDTTSSLNSVETQMRETSNSEQKINFDDLIGVYVIERVDSLIDDEFFSFDKSNFKDSITIIADGEQKLILQIFYINGKKTVDAICEIIALENDTLTLDCPDRDLHDVNIAYNEDLFTMYSIDINGDVEAQIWKKQDPITAERIVKNLIQEEKQLETDLKALNKLAGKTIVVNYQYNENVKIEINFLDELPSVNKSANPSKGIILGMTDKEEPVGCFNINKIEQPLIKTYDFVCTWQNSNEAFEIIVFNVDKNNLLEGGWYTEPKNKDGSFNQFDGFDAPLIDSYIY